MNGTANAVYSAAGITIQTQVSRSASGGIGQEDSLPAADAGSLTTRTSDIAGELTMDDAGHGITDGDVIDIFWATGVAYGATVGTVSGTAVPFTGASGDVLPSASTAVTADVEVPLDVDFDGDKLQLLAAMNSQRGHVQFVDSGSAVLDAAELTANEAYSYVADSGGSNPLTGNPVDQILISNASSDNASTFKMCCLYDSDT